MPTILRYLSVSLVSALVAAYTALWLANPAPLEQPHAVVRPPLIIQQYAIHEHHLLTAGCFV